MMQSRPNLKKAEEQFKLAIDKGEVDGYSQLARLYTKQKQTNKAITVFRAGYFK
ncbi:MAG: hypothetical protein KL787_10840 [Taibaiella sp.]|nr:hypothetical protein [Taibaiella sp.]